MKGNTVGGAHTREYGVVRIRISTVYLLLVQYCSFSSYCILMMFNLPSLYMNYEYRKLIQEAEGVGVISEDANDGGGEGGWMVCVYSLPFWHCFT